MKTTIELSDELFRAARKAAKSLGITLRALVEQGLREVLARRGKGRAFKLRDASVKGKGLHPDVKEGSWQQVRDLAYKGRGT